MKKILAVITASIIAFACFTGCANKASYSGANEDNFDTNKGITVVSREDGSGTRGAFTELFEIQEKLDDGSRKDLTTKEAVIADKTDIMMTNIANNPYAVGYISLGSLNGTIKAVDIDGVKASVENVKNGTYKIQRPFNIAVKGEATGLAKDFIDFILSDAGQSVVLANNYISASESAPAFSSSNPSGRIVVAGSSSVTPIMEKLREEYLSVNSSAVIEIQMSDSTAGMTSALNGTCDIGMASRELKDSEKADLTDIIIALDGIAVIVNNQNTVTNLSSEQVKNIFTGSTVKWSDVN